jgi:hypothetical protein
MDNKAKIIWQKMRQDNCLICMQLALRIGGHGKWVSKSPKEKPLRQVK